MVPNTVLYAFASHVCHTSRSDYRFDSVRRRLQLIDFVIMLFSPLRYFFLYGPNIVLKPTFCVTLYELLRL